MSARHRGADSADRRRPGELKIPSALAVLALTLTACSANTPNAGDGTPATPPPSGQSTQPSSAPSIEPSSAPATEPSSAPLDARGLPACTAPAPASTPAARPLPDLTFECLVPGSAVKLSDLRGKPTLVNLWAQWCGPCRQEAPYLAELAKNANGRVAVLGVDIADPRPELAIEFAAEHGWQYPHLRDPDHLLLRPLRIIGPPATAFVDAEGNLRYLHPGPFTSYAQLQKEIQDKLGVTL